MLIQDTLKPLQIHWGCGCWVPISIGTRSECGFSTPADPGSESLSWNCWAWVPLKTWPLSLMSPTKWSSPENWCQLLNQCHTGLAFVFPFGKIIYRTSIAASMLTSYIGNKKKKPFVKLKTRFCCRSPRSAPTHHLGANRLRISSKGASSTLLMPGGSSFCLFAV